MAAPAGRAFNGWKSDNYSNTYTAGSTYTVDGSTTFTAQWKPQGIYLGVISFAGVWAGTWGLVAGS
jgi:hypothetical protein